ncbi:MAG TPA: hypothetical protein VF331_23835 [Polyangiales bacterium]
MIRVWAIDYLAENIQAPTVTLHYPSERELIEEISKNQYTHIGINFVVATFHKVRAMAALIRKHAPDAKIILGGYGTVLPDSVLQPYGDFMCREEGVKFLRRLFNEPDAPFKHPHAPIPATRVLGYQRDAVVGHVTAGLGCTNGCDFCCTSHFFKQKYVPYSEGGRDIFEALMKTRERSRADGVEMNGFIVIDEDFFLHQKRAREFLDCVRENGEALSLMGFGSVRGLSQFTAREISEMGFDVIWNAFEGRESGYLKQKGRSLPELYADLKSVGVSQLTSMIIGFPYQDEQTIRDEFEALMALEPALTQCLIYFAFPGTPFHEQVIKEKRYLPRYEEQPDLRRWDGFSMHFTHPKIDRPERVEEIQRELYRKDFERLGPSVMRLGRVWLTGHLNLRNDPNPLLRKRAERHGHDLRGVLPALSATIAFAPSPAVRDRAIALRRDIIQATGELTLKERAMETASPLLHLVTQGARAAGVFQQPGLLRTEHRMHGADASRHTSHVLRLQGGLNTAPLQVLTEDLREIARRTAERVRPVNRLLDAARVITQRAQGLPGSLPAG